MLTLDEAVRARPALAGRLPLVEHLARAARVLAQTRSGTLGADQILIDGDATVVVGPVAGVAKVEPRALGPVADREEPKTETESPELAAVRSLGALLHLVLAGAFPGPEPVAELAAGAPAALVSIAERALGREKGAAYVGPAEVAADLDRWLAKGGGAAKGTAISSDPVAARRRRNALVAAASVAAIAILLLGLGWRRERRLRHDAVEQAEAARAAGRNDAFEVAQAYADKAAALAADDVQLSAAVYAAAVIDKTAADSRPQVQALRREAEGQILAARLGLLGGIDSDREAGGPVTAMAAAPRSLATAAGRGIKLWREKGEPAGAISGLGAEVVALAASDSGALLASAERNGAINVWDPASRGPLRELRKSGEPVADVAVAPASGGLVAAAERGGRVTLFGFGGAGGVTTRALAAHRADATAVAFAPRGDLLATGARDGGLALWNPASGATIARLGGHTAAVLDLAFAPEGRLLASGAADGSIRLWSPAERTLVAALAGHRAAVTSLAFSPDGAMLLAAAADGSVRAWFVADGRLAFAFAGHDRGAAFVAVLPDGVIASAGADGRVRTWRLGGARALRLPAELNGALAFSPDGSVIAAAAVDHRVHRMRVGSGRASRCRRWSGIPATSARSPSRRTAR